MTNPPPLIDPELTADQIGFLPADLVDRICAAFAQDLAQSGEALLNAAASGDSDAVLRARHSLKGLCGNFGAERVVALAEGPLIGADDRAAFARAMADTTAALAATLSQPE